MNSIAAPLAASAAAPAGKTPARRDLTIAGIVVGCIVVALALDVGASIGGQRAIGVVTWVILLLLIKSEERIVQAQVAVAVMFATIIEYTASPGLGFYVYRLENVPAFVPPGHGLVYLAAIALAREQNFNSIRRPLYCFVAITGLAWTFWGFVLAERGDLFGAAFFVLFALFMLLSRSRLVYAAAFLLTSFLELWGTSLGNWTWAAYDPSGFLSIGNPPSGIAGAYCVLDAVALALGRLVANFQLLVVTRSGYVPTNPYRSC